MSGYPGCIDRKSALFKSPHSGCLVVWPSFSAWSQYGLESAYFIDELVTGSNGLIKTIRLEREELLQAF